MQLVEAQGSERSQLVQDGLFQINETAIADSTMEKSTMRYPRSFVTRNRRRRAHLYRDDPVEWADEYDEPFDHGDYMRSDHYGSAGYYGSRSSSGVALAAIAILLILLAWIVLPSRTASSTPSVVPKETPIARDPINTRYVIVDELNLREGPNNRSAISHILPRGTGVILLGEAHRDLDGAIWLRVIVETLEGRQTGWVRERYIS